MSDATMRALQIQKHGGPEVMELVQLPVPEPGPKQARVKIDACGLNYSDVMIREGNYIDPTPPPYVLGREFCGTIDAVGDGVQGLAPGARVLGTAPGGALADYVVAPAAGLMPCPDGMEPEQGAALVVQGITAMHCVDDCGELKSGETLLVHAGAGGVGSLAVQIGVARGAKVFGTASTAEKCKTIEELGATGINYTEGDWVQALKDANGGRGADVILESVGGDVFRRSFREACNDFGRVVVFGMASTEVVEIDTREILESNKAIVGYYLARFFPTYMDRVMSATGRLMQLMGEGKLRPIVGQTFSLDDAAEAMNCLQNRQSVGKVVVKP